MRPEINALAEPLRLSAVERVTVAAVVPQLVKPDSTPPFCAKLLAGADETAALLEGELLAGIELGATLARDDERAAAPPHKLPLMVGRSALPPFLFT